ncbi:hypothetical protein ACF1BE_31200 [Streptomyces sp. NPDC014991]|uniref:hypothetical protein n=1 Tax=Streptomyces sp. NPDC014991 TaxID=3364935 RepID=UPI0036FBBB2A
MDLLEKCRAYARADEARDVGLYPFYPAFQGPSEGGQAVLDGAEVCMLGSNNYRALSENAQVIGAAQDAIALYGTSATGSRISRRTSPTSSATRRPSSSARAT